MDYKNKKQPEPAVTRALELIKAGEHRYVDIAKILNKEGLRSISGKPFSDGTISHIALAAGIRRKAQSSGYTRGGAKDAGPVAKRRRRAGGAINESGGGRWDLLRHIEQCSDLDAQTRKALLELVFREINK